jgi:hypothetical protein
MEQNSLDTVKMHLRHVVRTLGADFAILTLTLTHLQGHIERRPSSGQTRSDESVLSRSARS